MDAYFYNLNKRKNSTMVPTGTGTKINVVLKEGADLDHPVFQMHTNVLGYDLMKWENHYYFITGRRYVYNNFYEISCAIDSLGSYRSEIMSSQQYVLRSSVEQLADTKIFDNMYPLLVNPTFIKDEKDLGFFFEHVTPGSLYWPTYLVTIKGEAGAEVIAMNQGFFETIARSMYGLSQTDIWSALTTPSSFEKTYLDPFSYIIDVKKVPINIANLNVQSSSSQFGLGFWSYTDPDGDAGFKRVKDIIYESGDITFDIPAGPSGYYEFLNSNNARSIELYLPGCGWQTFDVEKIGSNDKVHITYTVDKKGILTYKFWIGDDIFFATCDISMPVSMHSEVSNLGRIATNAMQSIGGMISGAVTANAGAIINSATSLASSVSPQPLFTHKSLGVDGSWSALKASPNAVLKVTQYEVPLLSPDINGYPSCKTAVLDTAGYYLIKNPQVGFGDDLFIKNEIEAYMASGFYVE